MAHGIHVDTRSAPVETAMSARPALPPLRDLWPGPALFTWALAWGLFLGLRALDVDDAWALAAAATTGGLLALFAGTRARGLIVASGFPLSIIASGWLA